MRAWPGKRDRGMGGSELKAKEKGHAEGGTKDPADKEGAHLEWMARGIVKSF